MTAVILKHGDSGPGVIEVKDRLSRLGLLSVPAENVNDLFDDALRSAVLVFQQSRGLTVDGVVGPRTLRRLEEARWALGDRVLSFTPGHMVSGEDVAELQRRLNELGFVLDRVDGIFGKQTYVAIREFQRNVGIDVDGICGPDVFRALARLARTVAGGNQYHLRELAALDPHVRSRSVEASVIVLDPSFSGNKLFGSEVTEAEVCWDIVSRLEGRLSAVGAFVILTRSRNGQSQGERASAALANEQNADMTIGISMDRNSSSQAQGCATYYFGHQFSRSATGMRLAELIQEEVSGSGLLDCHAHPKTWDLLRLTRMPAVRVEVGYSTNEYDSAFLSDSKNRDHIAEQLMSAISRIFAPIIG